MSKKTLKKQSCEYNNFKRSRYFHGMLMTDRDFREEQIYHNEKRKLLNRMLHGWGVVCGLKMKSTTPESSKIIIKPGLAIDCRGNEIFVCEKHELDVAEMTKEPCNAPKKKLTPEEECARMDEVQSEENKWYVVIRYKEVPTDPVPVYAPGGGCEEKVCEYSRIREGYCFEILPANELDIECCPKPLQQEGGKCAEHKETEYSEKEEIREFLCKTLLMPCPGACCCKDPMVVLGSITCQGKILSDTQIEDTMINNWDCRKYVITFGLLQHWMMKLAPQEVPFNAIVDYAALGDACQSMESAVEVFKGICEEERDEDEQEPPVDDVVDDITEELTGKILEIIKKASSQEGITMTALSKELDVEPEVVKPVLAKLEEEGRIVKKGYRYFIA